MSYINFFSANARATRKLSKLAFRHERFATVLRNYADKAEHLYDSGEIPREMKVGGGVLSIYPLALDFKLDTDTVPLDIRILGDIGDDTPHRMQKLDISDPVHVKALTLANRATRKHLGNLQLSY